MTIFSHQLPSSLTGSLTGNLTGNLPLAQETACERAGKSSMDNRQGGKSWLVGRHDDIAPEHSVRLGRLQSEYGRIYGVKEVANIAKTMTPPVASLVASMCVPSVGISLAALSFTDVLDVAQMGLGFGSAMQKIKNYNLALKENRATGYQEQLKTLVRELKREILAFCIMSPLSDSEQLDKLLNTLNRLEQSCVTSLQDVEAISVGKISHLINTTNQHIDALLAALSAMKQDAHASERAALSQAPSNSPPIRSTIS